MAVVLGMETYADVIGPQQLVGLIEDGLAFTLAEATALALMFAYGYHARRLAGLPVAAAVRTDLTVACIGLLLSLGKGYVPF